MIMVVSGNTILVTIDIGDDTNIVLPDGYSYERIRFTHVNNLWGVPEARIISNSVLNFPPINSKSPNYFNFIVTDKTKPAEIRLVIEKFGQIPDAHYFDKAFEPILVTGDDGNEYKVIPSDQFK